jgi:hypothetical protein
VFGEIDGILAGTTGQIEGAGVGMVTWKQGEALDQKWRGVGGRMGDGIEVTLVPVLARGGHEEL